MMSWYILGYNNRKSSSVYTGRLGCDVIFLLFLSPPPPTSPLPLTSLIYLLPPIKILQGDNTEEGRRKVGEGDRKAYFKRMIPLVSLPYSTIPPLPGPAHAVSVQQPRDKSETWPAEVVEEVPLWAAEMKKKLSPPEHRWVTEEISPAKFCFWISPWLGKPYHTGTSENTWHKLMDAKEEHATLPGLGSEEGCKWTLPRDCATIWGQHQVSVRDAWRCWVWAGFQALLGAGMHSMDVTYSVLSSLLIWREEGGRCKEVSRRQGIPTWKNRSAASLIAFGAVSVSPKDTAWVYPSSSSRLRWASRAHTSSSELGGTEG